VTEAGAPASRFIGLTVIALAFIYWWIAVALFLVLFGERYFARRERESYMWLSALMLSYEMLVSNFGGLGSRFPDAYGEAGKQFIGYGSSWTRFLDIYLPARDQVDREGTELLAAFTSFD